MSHRTQALVKIIDQHLHAVDKCYPVAATPVTLTADSSGTGWLEGAKTEIVPVNTITQAFDITGVFVTASLADDYEVVIYVGAAGSEIEVARVAFSQTAAVDSFHLPCSTPVLAANERISGSVVSKTNSAISPQSAYVKLQFHEHDLD